MKKHQRALFISAVLCIFILVFSQCIQEVKKTHDPRGGAFAGSQRCESCHNDIYTAYVHTAQNLSTQPASSRAIKGSFAKDSNTYTYQEGLQVKMERRDSSFYQVAYTHDSEKQIQRFDITVGSGRKAQTYMYWIDDKVFQLPVSDFVPARSWVNSPNYPAHQVRFDRNIPIGVLNAIVRISKRPRQNPKEKGLSIISIKHNWFMASIVNAVTALLHTMPISTNSIPEKKLPGSYQ